MTGTLLLDSLPEADLRKIQEKLKPVVWTARQVLSTQGEFVEHVYFPATGLVSCRASGSQGELLEIYKVGHDGVVEAAAILTSIATLTAEMQIAGQVYRIKIDDLCMLLNQTEERTRILLKYTYSLAVRMVQATKCAMFHSGKERPVLWLLLANRGRLEQASCDCFELIKAGGEPELECELGA